MNTRDIGKFGEAAAERYLMHKGFKILDKNWTCYGGEIDLVVRDTKNKLRFIEVKYIGDSFFCNPEDLFGYYKKAHLLRSINTYLLYSKLDANDWYLDLVCLTKEPGQINIRHYEDVLHT